VQRWRHPLRQGVIPGELVQDTAAAAGLRLRAVFLLIRRRAELRRTLIVELRGWRGLVVDRILQGLSGGCGRRREDGLLRKRGSARRYLRGCIYSLGVRLLRRLRWRLISRACRCPLLLWLLLLILLIRGRIDGLLAGGLVDEGGWRDSDTLASRLEAILVRAVLDDAHLAGVVDEAVLAAHVTGRQLGLDLEGAVRALEPVRVRAILVVPVDLLQDRDRRRLRVLRRGRLPDWHVVGRVTARSRLTGSLRIVLGVIVDVITGGLLILLRRRRQQQRGQQRCYLKRTSV